MLKKLLAVSVAVIVLAGCVKEVTEDMLIGKWECNHVINKIALLDEQSGKLGEFNDIELQSWVAIYSRNGNSLYFTYDNNEPIAFNFRNTYSSGYQSHRYPPDYDKEYMEEFNIDGEYIFISNDEFKQISKHHQRYKESKQDILENNIESICKRVD